MTRLALLFSAIAVTAAHAEPVRLAPWRAGDVLQHVESVQKPKLRLERAPRVEKRDAVDEALAEAIARATHLAGRIAGLRHGLGPFVHVENLVSDAKGVDAPPRVIVIGVQLGGSPWR